MRAEARYVDQFDRAVLQGHQWPDPRSGETTTKLENVSRTQPDPALFLPPPDYKIVDESAGR